MSDVLLAQDVTVLDVTPRDGLQNEDTVLSTEQKLELISRTIDAGVRRIEAVSFVNPKRVPQMADADEVMAGVPRDRGVSYAGLVLNERGVERALAAAVDEVNFVIVLTDTFGQRNQGATTAESVALWHRVSKLLDGTGVTRSVTLAAAFGCPFEGEVPLERVEQVGLLLQDSGIDEISLADTIGCGVPSDVTRKVRAIAGLLPESVLRVHLHNTRNTGVANAWAAYEAGVTVFDASLGGVGGCPFAPAATGNLPMEDLVYLLDRSGVRSGIDLARLNESVPWIAEQLGHSVPGLLSRAGIFPSNGA